MYVDRSRRRLVEDRGNPLSTIWICFLSFLGLCVVLYSIYILCIWIAAQIKAGLSIGCQLSRSSIQYIGWLECVLYSSQKEAGIWQTEEDCKWKAAGTALSAHQKMAPGTIRRVFFCISRSCFALYSLFCKIFIDEEFVASTRKRKTRKWEPQIHEGGRIGGKGLRAKHLRPRKNEENLLELGKNGMKARLEMLKKLEMRKLWHCISLLCFLRDLVSPSKQRLCIFSPGNANTFLIDKAI